MGHSQEVIFRRITGESQYPFNVKHFMDADFRRQSEKMAKINWLRTVNGVNIGENCNLGDASDFYGALEQIRSTSRVTKNTETKSHKPF